MIGQAQLYTSHGGRLTVNVSLFLRFTVLILRPLREARPSKPGLCIIHFSQQRELPKSAYQTKQALSLAI